MWGPRGGASRSSCTEQLGQTERSGPSAGCAQQEEIDDSKKKEEGTEVWHLKMKKDVH